MKRGVLMPNESVRFLAESVNGKRGAGEIKKALDALPGVTSVAVNHKSNLISVDYENSAVSCDSIKTELLKMGYEIKTDLNNIGLR